MHSATLDHRAGNLRAIVLSAVYPFPGFSGQQQRVRNKLIALRQRFHTTFLTFAPLGEIPRVRRELLSLCDEAIVLASRYVRTPLHSAVFRLSGALFAVGTGLKRSNHLVGCVELSPSRVRESVLGRYYDIALYEYWHAVESTTEFRRSGTLCVLDMHNLLWRSYEMQLKAKPWVPLWLRQCRVAAYRRREERAWRQFDALISINRGEHSEVRSVLGKDACVIYAPMGLDFSRWPYSWNPVVPPRIVYYGGLGSPHNSRDALRCFQAIMPKVWRERPDAQLWIVGSNPPSFIRALEQSDDRVKVTGYVENAAEILSSATTVLCPWEGTYGFRSRLVEAMALGLPVVASPDAVTGMELRDGQDLMLATTDEEMARVVLRIIEDRGLALGLSRTGRVRSEQLYSFAATYGKLALELEKLVLLSSAATPS